MTKVEIIDTPSDFKTTQAYSKCELYLSALENAKR